MRSSSLKIATAAAALLFTSTLYAQSGSPTPVVATFSIIGDMVSRIGGDHVDVTTLVGPNGDTHVYQPTPKDAKSVSEAGVLVVNGLEFEGWLERLIAASDFDGVRVVATRGIDPIAFEDGDEHHDDDHDSDEHHEDEHHEENEHAEHDEHDDDHGDEHGDEHDDEHKDDHGDEHDHHHGAFDPHTWQSLTNAIVYVDNITAALAQSDPANAATFYQNRAKYVDEIKSLDAEIRGLISGLPSDRRTVVTSHDAFQYFGRDYGVTFLAPQGLSTDSEASAKDVAKLIKQMRSEGISAVFLENITDSRLLEQIANETGAKIGGTLYPGALSDADGPAPTYLDMMRHNATTLTNALSQ
ncbi:MAG: metal ABC transporter substrate-binding protein [Pseudomonadota bacterium]